MKRKQNRRYLNWEFSNDIPYVHSAETIALGEYGDPNSNVIGVTRSGESDEEVSSKE